MPQPFGTSAARCNKELEEPMQPKIRTWLGVATAATLLMSTVAIAAPGKRFNSPANLTDKRGARFIVTFKDMKQGSAALEEIGAHVVHAFPKYDTVAAYIPERAIEGLRHNKWVASIEADVARWPMAQTTPYGITMVQALQVADTAAGNTTVCIIDSGYYSAHEDLQSANVTASPDSGSGNPYVDGCGHGTHVAGTVAALNNSTGVIGVNRNGNVNLHIVKVFGNDCAWAYSSSLVAALDQCAQQGGNIVVNMSLGGSQKSNFENRAFRDANNAGILSIAAAGNDGNTRHSYPASYDSVVSVAAIDSNMQVASFSQQTNQVELAAPGVGVESTVPYIGDHTITVGGNTYSGGAIEFAAQSSGASGPVVDGGLCDSVGSWSGAVVMCERGSIAFNDKVQNAQAGGAVAAIIYNNVAGAFSGTLGAGNTSAIPAISLSQADGQAIVNNNVGQSGTVVNLSTTGSGYDFYDGTSMATPHVAGVAALIWSHYPSRTNTDVRNALTQSALDLGPAGRDNAYGFGLVQASAAEAILAGGSGCTPTETTESSCNDGLDNDCDGAIDSADSDCNTGGGCNLGQSGDACTNDSDCCSNKCKGPPGRRTCR
ncbi:MAG: S8 family serine peptidase [Deltaproteobacteria bacterium]